MRTSGALAAALLQLAVGVLSLKHCKPGQHVRGHGCADCPAGYYCPTSKAKEKSNDEAFIVYCPKNRKGPEHCPVGFECHNSSVKVPCTDGTTVGEAIGAVGATGLTPRKPL